MIRGARGCETAGDDYLLAMRKHIAWYTKGMPSSAAVRREVNSLSTYGQFRELIQRVFYR